jgi:hypothetical protein
MKDLPQSMISIIAVKKAIKLIVVTEEIFCWSKMKTETNSKRDLREDNKERNMSRFTYKKKCKSALNYKNMSQNKKATAKELVHLII